MKIAELQHFPLTEGYLCNDCQSLHNSNSECPACASKSIDPVTRWIPANERGQDNECS